MYIFDALDNPTATNLKAVSPDIIFPEGYDGLNSDHYLAATWVSLIHRGVFSNVEAIAAQTDSTYPGVRLTGVDGFTRLVKRYHIDQPEFLFYMFSTVLDMADPTHWYYVLALAAHYGNRVIDLSSTLLQIITLQDETTVHVPVDVIDNVLAINARLRADGIIWLTNDIYVLATRWDPEQAYQLAVHHVPPNEAVELSQMGFKTADAIIRYRHRIPKSFVDDMLRPKKLPKVAEF